MKIHCSKCDRDLPPEDFAPSQRKPGAWCRTCQRDYQTIYQAAHYAGLRHDTLQQCGRCHSELTLEHYAPSDRGKPRGWCRECRRQYKIEWRALHPTHGKNVWKPRWPGNQPGLPPHKISVAVPLIPKRKPQQITVWPPARVTYANVHAQLRKTKGPAQDHTCADCGNRPAYQWAYDHTDPSPRYGRPSSKRPNGSRRPLSPYSPDLDRYRPLCASCHVQLDRRAAIDHAVQQRLIELGVTLDT